jgi:ABC-type branched-subunit amino acid transport system ATPase component
LRERGAITFSSSARHAGGRDEPLDRVIVMAQGKVIADGAPHEVRGNERVIGAYLGAGPSSRRGSSRPCRVDILNGVNMVVRRGEMVTLVGPNGAGKSTLVKAIVGLLPPRAGHVLLRGNDVTGERPHKIIAMGVGYVPQRENVFPSMSVEENVELGLIARRGDGAVRAHDGFELFPQLARFRRRPAGTLSGGERQMLAMARTLIAQPDVVLLDDLSRLCPSCRRRILEDRRDQRGGDDNSDGRTARAARSLCRTAAMCSTSATTASPERSGTSPRPEGRRPHLGGTRQSMRVHEPFAMAQPKGRRIALVSRSRSSRRPLARPRKSLGRSRRHQALTFAAAR